MFYFKCHVKVIRQTFNLTSWRDRITRKNKRIVNRVYTSIFTRVGFHHSIWSHSLKDARFQSFLRFPKWKYYIL